MNTKKRGGYVLIVTGSIAVAALWCLMFVRLSDGDVSNRSRNAMTSGSVTQDSGRDSVGEGNTIINQ